MENTKLGGRIWVSLIIFGLFGQIAWVVENMYLNVFLYKTVTYDPTATAVMVAASAAVATLTTLLMGVLSDKLAKRKPFIAIGYIIWGFVIMAFSLIKTETIAQIFPGANAVFLAAAFVVLLDCVMTFFGSTANDACFNAWVTDVTKPGNRGRAEGVLSALPLVATMVVFGGLDGFTQKGQWSIFFAVIGILVTVGGFVGLFLLKDQPNLQAAQQSFSKNVVHGFRPSVIKENRVLYVIFCAMALSGIAQQIFMPYLLIYLEYSLGITDYALPLAALLLLAAAASVLGGRLVDCFGKRRFIFPAAGALILGLLAMFLHGQFLKENGVLTLILLVLFGAVMMGGNMLLGLILGASARNVMPERSRGLFNGIRMIFMVLLPMLIGPFVGSAIIKNGTTFLDEFGQVQYIPHEGIFLGGAVAALLLIVPLVWLRKKNRITNEK